MSDLKEDPYQVPREDRAASSHDFASDVDQQKILAGIRSEIAALKDQVSSLAARVEKLEKDRLPMDSNVT
jgi:hypothetical protein